MSHEAQLAGGAGGAGGAGMIWHPKENDSEIVLQSILVWVGNDTRTTRTPRLMPMTPVGLWVLGSQKSTWAKSEPGVRH